MKKVLLLVCVLTIFFGMTACSNKKEPIAVTLTPAQIEDQIATAIGKDNYLCDFETDKDTVKDYFNLDMTQVKDVIAKQNAISAVNPDMVVIMQVAAGYADKAIEGLNAYYANVVNYSRLYAFSVAKVTHAKIYKCQNYVMYLLAGAQYDGEDQQAAEDFAIAEYAKIDNVIKSIFGEIPENLAVIPAD